MTQSDWAHDLLTAATARKVHRRRPLLTVVTSVNYMRLLNAAAKKRDLSVAAYVRRAAAAFIAHDTGTTFAAVLADVPAPTPYGSKPGKGPDSNWGRTDDATGHGKWLTHSDD